MAAGRLVRAWSMCVSRGRLRGLYVLGGVLQVCLRFAWQVWDFGCIDALGKALDGGSAFFFVTGASKGLSGHRSPSEKDNQLEQPMCNKTKIQVIIVRQQKSIELRHELSNWW